MSYIVEFGNQLEEMGKNIRGGYEALEYAALLHLIWKTSGGYILHTPSSSTEAAKTLASLKKHKSIRIEDTKVRTGVYHNDEQILVYRPPLLWVSEKISSVEEKLRKDIDRVVEELTGITPKMVEDWRNFFLKGSKTPL